MPWFSINHIASVFLISSDVAVQIILFVCLLYVARVFYFINA